MDRAINIQLLQKKWDFRRNLAEKNSPSDTKKATGSMKAQQALWNNQEKQKGFETVKKLKSKNGKWAARAWAAPQFNLTAQYTNESFSSPLKRTKSIV